MKREIKFRAFTNGKMYYDVELTNDGWVHWWGERGIECEAIGTIYDNRILNKCILMQYTGLKDKTGSKEIYERDIVKGCCFNGSYAFGKVIQSRTGWIVSPIGKFLEGYDDIDVMGIEVVGNDCENPELL